jgi:hypothetical protein
MRIPKSGAMNLIFAVFVGQPRRGFLASLSALQLAYDHHLARVRVRVRVGVSGATAATYGRSGQLPLLPWYASAQSGARVSRQRN